MNRSLAIPAALVLGLVLSSSYLLDGPSEADIERAVAADLVDAQAQAHREAPQVRAELARLEADRIELTPVEVMHRYAQLGAGK